MELNNFADDSEMKVYGWVLEMTLDEWIDGGFLLVGGVVW